MLRFVGTVMVFWLLLGGVAKATDAGSEKKSTKERAIMGWVEPVVFIPWGVELKAKLDSGAKTSSLHAEHIVRFKKGDEEWVRFALAVEIKGKEIKQFQMEQPLVRDVLIKRHRGSAKRRPVVNLKLCLNGKHHRVQFSLVDRSQLNYPVLLGRRFLRKVALIDPGKTFLTSEGWKTCLIEYTASEVPKD
ncbi:ATP-dependent zinc protease [Nitrosococcus watsonii]|uniref:Retropepsin-like aspartic endopeptidase domain-containing protein n=1 Tax=Nitrosococcus watsoni (strain C-113) TaxID=105559 RepID=D8K7A9_NITWC|nr:RimK/LysX family protein [Nitrosococcus watsonii]ADJ28786.1 protein of unknown function DUF785 [Nitrosococcus watsonii C-113]